MYSTSMSSKSLQQLNSLSPLEQAQYLQRMECVDCYKVKLIRVAVICGGFLGAVKLYIDAVM